MSNYLLKESAIAKRDVIRLLEAYGAKDAEFAYHSVALAIARGDDPNRIISTVKKNRPNLFYRD